MIYDCFLFNNELDLLEIRLHELAGVVDKFVLVEANVTHVNKPKPLYYTINKKRFRQFEKKIIHIVVKDNPDVKLPWILNDFQFSQMIRGLRHCKPSDIILFGDADEIAKAETVEKWKNKSGKHKIFSQSLSYYFLNNVAVSKEPWLGSHMMLYKDLIRHETTWIAKFSNTDVIIPDGGWHFSYMGGIKSIQKKFASMAHQEYNNSRFNTPEHIKKSILKKEDLLYSGLRFVVKDYSFLPKYVQNHTVKFNEILIDPEKRNRKPSTIFLGMLDVLNFVRKHVRAARITLLK